MLPGPYERWFVELTGRSSPVETRSTCDDCAMLPGAPDLPPEGPFDPALRCCTYHPQLAPHLVGGILATGSDEGRARVRARIAARVGVSPLGLGPTPEAAAIFASVGRRAGAFGRSHELRCPFLGDDERCTIWQHRGVPCAAFHCKWDRGAIGFGLWNVIVAAFHVTERALARWLLSRHGLDAAACDALLRAPSDATLDERAWAGWRGREEEYFIDAARAVESLSFREVESLGGRELAGLGNALRGVVERVHARALPERVRGNDQILQIGLTRLRHPSVTLDLLEIPSEVAARVKNLEPTPLAELGLDEALLRRLLDWQVLLPDLG